MADPYAELMKAIGFGAADATDQIGLLQRKQALGESDIARQGDLDRRQLLGTQEGNGVLSSGETGMKLSDLNAAQASQSAGLSLATADSASAVQRSINEQAAQAQAQQLAQQQSTDEFNQNMALSQQQLQQQKTQFDQQQALLKLAPAPFDPSTLFPQYRRNGGA